MSFRSLRIVLQVGKLLAFTPGHKEIKNETIPQKVYSYSMVTLITVGVGISVGYRQPDYVRLSYMRAIIQILLDSILYLLNICTILTALWKRPQWHKLTKNLKTVQNHNNIVEKSDRFLFVFYNLIYCGYQTYMTLIFYDIMGVEFFKQFAIEYLQLYGQFIINFAFYVFSKVVLVRYRSLRKNLESQVRLVRKLSSRRVVYSLDHLNRIKYDIYLLKESVDIINNLFGWPVLLNIMFAGLQMLVYMQGIVVGAFYTYDTIIYTVMIILWHCVITLSNILLCDAVSSEVNKILSVAYSLDKHSLGDGRNDLTEFIDVVKDNFPIFSAARFFDINRSTIFGIFDAIITFLIVMIQFESHRISTTGQSCGCNGTSEI
ncbi:hypothetical protein MTP99_000554 [Tenebrio molitor]|uniref:Gustatory receptor n=1 Tax=Tenebrio molitor TaxID=7067 RepID=A0A8J6HW63_TENMO|nr:hypothetical protein GEV33_002138 [Tenebrio molitor]KAJ3637069.1 hypothetical protein MTP99_000554 [Tenebrio molitor]